MKFWLFPVLMIASQVLAQSQWDFQTDSLFVVSGPKGATLSAIPASVRLTSNDSSIIVQVSVRKHKKISTTGADASDRIELWFAESDFYSNSARDCYEGGRRTTYICSDTSCLYQYQGRSDLKRFKKEIADPVVVVSELDEDGQYKYKSSALSSIQGLEDVDFEIDDFLQEARSSSLKRVASYYELVHFGVLPKTGRTVLYNKDAYRVVERQAHVGIPDYASFVKVTSKSSDSVDTTTVEIPARALGFITLTGYGDILFLANIVRSEGTKEGYVLSTAKNPDFDRPETFNDITLKSPVRAPVLSMLKGFNKYQAGRSGELGRYAEYFNVPFIFTTRGWVQIDWECGAFRSGWQGGPWYELPNIRRFRFKPARFEYREDTLSQFRVGHLGLSGADLIIINDEEVYSAQEIVRAFLLPDGNLGLLRTQVTFLDPHTENEWMASLFLDIRSETTQLLELEAADEYEGVNGSYLQLGDSLRVSGKEWGQDKFSANAPGKDVADWNSVLTLQEDRKGLILDLGYGPRFRIAWDEHGRNVNWSKL